MSSFNDNDVTGALTWLNLINTKNQARTQFWVHPYCRANSNEHSDYRIFKEQNLYLERFHSFYTMSKKSSFDRLVTKVAQLGKKTPASVQTIH